MGLVNVNKQILIKYKLLKKLFLKSNGGQIFQLFLYTIEKVVYFYT